MLVLLGKQAIDDDNNQTGQMLAGLWDRPQATFASKLRARWRNGAVSRVRWMPASKCLEVDLPAVVTVDLRLNEPRFVKLPDIIKAKKKPLGDAGSGGTRRNAAAALHHAALRGACRAPERHAREGRTGTAGRARREGTGLMNRILVIAGT